MNQSALIQSVARATGESASRIRRMGFTLLVPPVKSARRQGRHSQEKPIASRGRAPLNRPA